MAEAVFNTIQLRGWVDRIQQGDRAAQEELLRAAAGRLERLARKMLKGYPTVSRWEDTSDVLQNAMLRLVKSLRDVSPPSVAAFIGLAATQVRRELIDLARHYHGPEGLGANHASQLQSPNPEQSASPSWEPASHGVKPEDLERWSKFHQAVEELPAEEKQVVDLLFYQGLSQLEAAEAIGISDRTVRRAWRTACIRLQERLGPEGVPLGD